MNKFGLDPEDAADEQNPHNLAERLAAFPLAAPRPRLNITEVDAAAAPHGFVSREATAGVAVPQNRRRRLGTVEPTRHLAVRLTTSQYDRFVAYADEHQLTYQDAIAKLLSSVAR